MKLSLCISTKLTAETIITCSPHCNICCLRHTPAIITCSTLRPDFFGGDLGFWVVWFLFCFFSPSTSACTQSIVLGKLRGYLRWYQGMQDDGLGRVGPTAGSLPWLLLGAICVVIVLYDVAAVAVVGLVVRSGLSRIICKHKSQSLRCEQQGFHGSRPVTF